MAEIPRPAFRFQATREDILGNLRTISEFLGEGVQAGQLTQQQIGTLVDGLPRILEKELIDLGEKDNFCPICFVPYLTILTEEEMASAMESPAHPVEELGVTKLSQSWQCGHMFCRRDISKWISDGHASCPMCRRNLIENPTPEQQTTEEQETEAAARLEEFNRSMSYMGGQMGALQDYLRSIGVEQSEFNDLWRSTGGNQRDEEPEDDRHEYSGMYS